ncbi:MAG: quinone oxidoreductase [Acidimicrobiia bacterium]|nr:quinone oxidoreductase [Acidimicrobiia bacterium]
MRAIQVAVTGESDVLRMAVVPDPEPGPGEALVQLEACGINFIDVYQRRGLYPLPLPFILGQEGAGVVVALGPDSGELAVGDRVAFTSIMGAYAEQIVVPAARLVAVPDAMETPTAAAIMLQGLTAHYLAFDTFQLEPGSTCLIHAGAGGVGLLLIQVAKRLGATVFTTVGTDAKAELATAAGADHVIVYTGADFAAEVRSVVGESGLDVVYDSVGVDTFDRSLELLRPRGLLALFGQSSGPVAPLDLSRLARGGSLYVTRPTLGSYIASREELERRSRDLFGWVVNGELSVRIGSTYPLEEAAAAHDALEGRATTGKVLLLP